MPSKLYTVWGSFTWKEDSSESGLTKENWSFWVDDLYLKIMISRLFYRNRTPQYCSSLKLGSVRLKTINDFNLFVCLVHKHRGSIVTNRLFPWPKLIFDEFFGVPLPNRYNIYDLSNLLGNGKVIDTYATQPDRLLFKCWFCGSSSLFKKSIFS